MNCSLKIAFKFAIERLFQRELVLKRVVRLSKRKRKSRKEQSRRLLMPLSSGENFTRLLTKRVKECTPYKVPHKKLDMLKKLSMTTLINWDWLNTISSTSQSTNPIRLASWEDLLKHVRKNNAKALIKCSMKISRTTKWASTTTSTNTSRTPVHLTTMNLTSDKWNLISERRSQNSS